MNKRLIYTISAILLTLSSSTTANNNSRRIPIPQDVFYYQPAATVFGSESAWINPGGLGRYNAAGYQLMADYFEGGYARSWGMVVHGERTATAYRHIDNPDGTNYEEWLTAAGMKLGRSTNLGLSYRYYRKGPGIYNHRHFWTLGLISHGKGPFIFGAVFSNLNRGRVDGEQTATEQRYSLAYRFRNARLTLATDMFLSTRNSVRDADFKYHAEFIPKLGLYLNASIDSDRNFQIGFRTNLLRYFAGTKNNFDRDGHNGRTTAFIGATNLQQASLIPERRRRLSMKISGTTTENPPKPVFGRHHTPFVDLVTTIYRAAQDSQISEITVSLDRLRLGFARAQELRKALGYFREQDKRVVCYLSSPGNLDYYVATVADAIVVPPVSQLRLVGLRAELTFYAGTLEKLGVKIELLRMGDYKTAAETYTREAASEENREQVNRLLDDLYDQFVHAIADGRGWSEDSVRAIIDNGPYSSKEALEFGLIDGLAYRDEMDTLYTKFVPEVSFQRYVVDTLLNDNWQSLPVLAVVVAEGEISSDRGEPDPLGRRGGVTPSPMARAFYRASHDPDVHGIVFRINSPGGFALAGEKIYHDAAKAAERRPMVVSMVNVAASGGYYVGMPASYIFADPVSITGSIGIYGGKADFSELYDKIDLGKELYTRGRYAGMLSTSRPFTADEREKYRFHLEAFYDHFVNLVADSRQLTSDSVNHLGQGRVWTGREALANGLVDSLGGLKDALDFTASLAGVEQYRIELYPKRRPWFIWPGRSLFQSIASVFFGGQSPLELLPVLPLPSEDELLLTRMPYDISIE